ncbi:MAG TPA: DUF222 domain-containing protein [Streptosporangiaceae bacterium]|nr:DUF222 domain-containing protein [Streptosporangiaceae bacterium]
MSSSVPGASAPAGVAEAMAMVRTGLRFLAAADATQLTLAELADCLRNLEHANSVAVAARTSVLTAFNAGQGYTEDGDYSACSWLRNRTQITHGTAVGHSAWVKRAAGHPLVHAALGGETISESYAREICWWTDKLSPESRQAADDILLGAAASGLELPGLAGLAAEMYERSRQDKPDTEGPDGDGDCDGQDPDRDEDRVLDDRSVTLATTLGGAGVVRGALTPECAEFVQTVLDALSGPAGADDDRTHEQRYHDALHEAMRRLVAADLVPRRSGQPLKVWAHISLADLMALPGSTELVDEWARQLSALWAGRRAAAVEAGGHQGLWLDGDAARRIACGAPVTPVIVGDVNPAAFSGLIRLCAQLDKLQHPDGQDEWPFTDQPAQDPDGEDLDGEGRDGEGRDGQNRTGGAQDDSDCAGGAGIGSSASAAPGSAGAAADGAAMARQALAQAIIAKAVELLSGPGGLASSLRREQLGDLGLGGPSLPLDIGYSDTVPAGIRNAVRLRDKHCQWAGGCRQPAGACQVHHTRHKASGGKTSLRDCVLLCDYHHQVMIHRRGWTLVVNSDGTTTAWNKDKTKILHSHSPPARAG